ncbi:MAG: PQQ-dependent sugar dehydrogenase [Oligoflexia bacterium]|nr:PQQ-dependent sugar dehydrogenase [Oligoflexia bacterium]
MKNFRLLFIFVCLILNFTTGAKVQKLIDLGSGNVIWGFDFIKENEIILTTREGLLYHFNLMTNKKKKLNSPKVYSRGQGGLLDIKARDEKGKKYLYVTYSKEVSGGESTTALAKAEYTSNLIWKDLFVANAKSSNTRHYGSRIIFVENYIYMTIGDRGEREKSQDDSVHNGMVLRIDQNGKAIMWTNGHRNPQGITYDPAEKKIYTAEFGPLGGDEINLLQKGKNYGWPIITYGKNYWGTTIGPGQKKGYEQPLVYWTPSISPSALTFFKEEDKSGFYLACLGSRHLRKVFLENGKITKQVELYKDLEERIRNVHVGPDKKVYFSTDSGKIFVISS